MEISKTITQLSNLIIDQSIHQPRPLEELKRELSERTTQVKAMRTIVSMTQQNHDTSCLLSDVIKIIDTNNYELKVLCNYYFRIICLNRPACLLMCTNVFFKDFNDRNFKIQQLALIDSIELSDEILIRNYVKDVKRMVSHPRREIRMLACRCLSLFYLKNKPLYLEENLTKYLKVLLMDPDDSVRVSSLRAIAVIEYHEDIMSSEDVLKIANEFWECGNTNGLRCAIDILRHKKATSETKAFLLRTLKHSDISIFYLSASKIIEDGLFYQEIYDQAVCFMDASTEQLQNLLTFLYSLIGKFTFRYTDFIIRNTDENSIRYLKLKILLRIYNSSPDQEEYIKKCIFEETDQEVLTGIFEFCIKNQIFVDSFVSRNDLVDIVLSGIYRNLKIMENSRYRQIVEEFLYKVKRTSMPKIFIILASEFCSKIPEYIFKIDIGENCHLLIMFYLRMMNNGVINEHQCQNYLKYMKKKCPSVHRIDIVLDRLNLIDPSDVCNDYDECMKTYQGKFFNDCIEVESVFRKCYEENKVVGNSIIINPDCHDSVGNNTMINPECHDSVGNPVIINPECHEIINDDSQRCLEECNKSNHTQKEHYSVDSLPVYIDSLLLKGILDIDDNKFVLTVDIIEKEEFIKYSIGPIEHEDDISCEGRYVLFEITDDMKDNEYTIEIGGMVYSGKI